MGGSEEKMQSLNEAYEVLTTPGMSCPKFIESADSKNCGSDTIMEKTQMIHMQDNNKIHSHTMEAVATHSSSSNRVLEDSHSLVELEDKGSNLSSRYRYCKVVDHVACMFMYVL